VTHRCDLCLKNIAGTLSFRVLMKSTTKTMK
jgi:hypothetical protein